MEPGSKVMGRLPTRLDTGIMGSAQVTKTAKLVHHNQSDHCKLNCESLTKNASSTKSLTGTGESLKMQSDCIFKDRA